jgi:hypothetical protein
MPRRFSQKGSFKMRKGFIDDVLFPVILIIMFAVGVLISWLLKKYPDMAIFFDNISVGDVAISAVVLVLLPVIFSARHLYTISMGSILFAMWLITPLFIREAGQRYLI